MRRLPLPLIAVVLVMAWAPAASAQTDGSIEVAIDPPVVNLHLGTNTEITVTVTNHGDTATAPLAVHIDITDPTEAGSVDPEDWTATLTQQVGALAQGQSVAVGWTLQPIAGGSFLVYAVALSADSTEVAASSGIAFTVSHSRSLNPEGILPAAIAVPVVIGVLLALQWRRGKRGPQESATARIANR